MSGSMVYHPCGQSESMKSDKYGTMSTTCHVGNMAWVLVCYHCCIQKGSEGITPNYLKLIQHIGYLQLLTLHHANTPLVES